MRRSVAVALVGLTIVAAVALAEGSIVLVEDWSRQPPDRHGVPEGWTRQSWGKPAYDFRVIADGAERVLHLKSRGDNSTISKEVTVDVRRFPVLAWRWKVVTLPAGGDSRRPEADDQAAQIYVTFPRFPAAVRSRIIGYVWDTTAPVGTIVKRQGTPEVAYVVVRSGDGDLGRWLAEMRDVVADYRAIWGTEPTEELKVVSVGIDSNDTRSSAESYVGALLFRAR